MRLAFVGAPALLDLAKLIPGERIGHASIATVAHCFTSIGG